MGALHDAAERLAAAATAIRENVAEFDTVTDGEFLDTLDKAERGLYRALGVESESGEIGPMYVEMIRIQLALRAQLESAERERDEARRMTAAIMAEKPGPTAWAYEQACKALEAKREQLREIASLAGKTLIAYGGEYRRVYSEGAAHAFAQAAALAEPRAVAAGGADGGPEPQGPGPTTRVLLIVVGGNLPRAARSSLRCGVGAGRE